MRTDFNLRMTGVSFGIALAILFTTSTYLYSQTGVSGTWRVDGVGQALPWDVVLREDGARVYGAVSSCPSPRPSVEISEGRLDGSIVTFKCKTVDAAMTLTFTGRINGDEIAFGWELKSLDGFLPNATNLMFGPSAPPRFTAKRVPDAVNAALVDMADSVPGVEFAAAVNVLPKDVKVEGTLFLPQKVSRAQAVIVVIRYGLGFAIEQDTGWQKLAEATNSGLLFAQFTNINVGPFKRGLNRMNSPSAPDALNALLNRLSQDSGHREIADAPLVLWGQSAAGQFEVNFAQLHPRRTVALVLYHSGEIAGADMKVLSRLPTLLLAGGKDTLARVEQEYWKSGRALGAAWTFVLDPDSPHGDEPPLYPYLKKSDYVMIPWITAVLRQRIPSIGTTLRPVTDGSGWMGNLLTGEVAPYNTYSGSKAEASWLPDEASVQGWRRVQGATK